MENRVPSYEERKLTNAIERAATVCSVNEGLDRDETLAQQLKKASIDPKFAKTAAQAFNKRLTVLTFKKTADEHKADPFQLSDPDKVYELVSGKKEDQIQKSAKFDMSVDSIEEPMQKAASCEPPNVIIRDKRFEHLCSWDTFKARLESDMEKLASAFRDITYEIECRENAIADQAKEVADYFKKANYDFDFTTAVNLHGEKLHAAIGHLVDSDVSFEKTANFVIRPKKDIFDKVAKLLEESEELDNIKWFASEFATGLAEFAKTAGELGDEYQIKEADLAPQLTTSRSDVNRLTRELQDLRDRLDQDATDGTFGVRAGGLADVGVGTIAGLGEAATGAINDISGAARTALNNAKTLYYAGNNVSISPGDLLDAAFLTKDRYRDRLLAWSDMSADPQLSMYPAEQVFAATQKAMDLDTSMERPDRREVLRAQVAQLLAQNNRVSTADIAALAVTLKELTEAAPSAQMEAAKEVSALSDKAEPGLQEQKDIIGEFGDTEGLKGLRTGAFDDLRDAYKELDEIDKNRRTEERDAVKERATELSTAEKRLQSLEDKQETRDYETDKERRKQRADHLQRRLEAANPANIIKALGYREVIDPNSGVASYQWAGGNGRRRGNTQPPYGRDVNLQTMQRIVDAIRNANPANRVH